MTRALPVRIYPILLALLVFTQPARPQEASEPKADSKNDPKADKLATRSNSDKGAAVEQEPPEEDPDLQPEVFAFNPLEAKTSLEKGDFYLKKGNTFAAARRYEWATKYDPASKEAFLKLGDADLKLRNFKAARQAFNTILTLSPDPKMSEAVKKKLAKMPPENRTKLSSANNSR